MTQLGMVFLEWKIELPVSFLYIISLVSELRSIEINLISLQIPPQSRSCRLNAEETLKAVLHTSLLPQGRLSDVYPALTAPGLAAGMAASALNLNGLEVMNRYFIS